MVERIYYPINEATAKLAHSLMSMRDYVPGSKTEEYKGYVDNVYDLVDELEKCRPDILEEGIRLAERYSRYMADYINKDCEIGTRCPSVMICGAGNFPTKKKEKQVAAWENNYKNWEKLDQLYSRIANLKHKESVIKSGDDDAIAKLEEKIEKLESLQNQMKGANAYYRKHKTIIGCDLFSEDQQKSIQESMDKWNSSVPFASYSLTNNNANLKRLKGRLEDLKRAKSTGTTETENEFFKVVKNTDIMRLQLIFDGKPEANVRDILKGNGFKWAPSQGAWQRNLNTNGEYALKRVERELAALSA